MRGFNCCRVLLFLGLAVFSAASNAAYYTWYSSYFNITAGSPGAVCDQIDGVNNNLSGFIFTNETQTQAQCLSNAGNPVSSTNMVRNGTGCQPTYIYNSATGGCEAPPPDECPGKTGVSSPFAKSGSFNDGYYSSSGGWGAPAQDGCFDGCTASTVNQKCTGNLKTSTYKCRGTMTYTGANCTTSPAPEVDETTDTSRPEPEAYKDQTPCNYTTGPTGSLVCTSSNTEGKEGQSCGTVNGVQTCIDTKPTQNGIEISTKIETSNNADGSTTTTKTDTANSTNCTGINQCTSSTTTTTTTTVKDGNGNTTSVTGSCTGPQCPDTNTNPDGDGDGFGDCIGDDCGEGGGAGVEGPELEEVPGYGDSLETYWSAIQGAPIVAAVTAISLPAGGNCPVYTETIEYIGTVSTATACDLASGLLTPLHYLFLAIWAFVAVRTTMTA